MTSFMDSPFAAASSLFDANEKKDVLDACLCYIAFARDSVCNKYEIIRCSWPFFTSTFCVFEGFVLDF